MVTPSQVPAVVRVDGMMRLARGAFAVGTAGEEDEQRGGWRCAAHSRHTRSTPPQQQQRYERTERQAAKRDGGGVVVDEQVL